MQDEKLPTYRPDGRALGILFEDVDIWGTVAGESRAEDVLAIFEDILVRWPTKLFRQVIGRPLHATRRLVQGATGVVPPGETLLVLGRPGAGCSTLLKVLANQRGSFKGVDGAVQYGGITAPEMARHHGSEVVYNGEDDVHFPTLSVAHTMAFALKLRKPRRLKAESDAQFARRMAGRILGALSIGHTADTVVGDAFVRGVSGGERKRVSLAEVLAAAPAVVCWDNPLRGLDSSSALAFLRLLRAMSDATGMANVVTAYQISESIYRECFDRVLVLYEGRVIYSGRAGDEAKDYFTNDLGFHCPMRQTTPDFLSAVTSPEEQRAMDGFQPRPPLDPDGLAEAFRRSPKYKTLQQDVQYFRENTAKDETKAASFQAEFNTTKDPLSPKSFLTIRSPHTQLLAAMARYYQLIWGGRRDLLTVLALNTTNALRAGRSVPRGAAHLQHGRVPAQRRRLLRTDLLRAQRALRDGACGAHEAGAAQAPRAGDAQPRDRGRGDDGGGPACLSGAEAVLHYPVLLPHGRSDLRWGVLVLRADRLRHVRRAHGCLPTAGRRGAECARRADARWRGHAGATSVLWVCAAVADSAWLGLLDPMDQSQPLWSGGANGVRVPGYYSGVWAG